MRFSIFFFIAFLALFSLTLAQDEDCCLRDVNRVKNRVISYRRQELDGRCDNPAIVLTLENGRVFCADPRERWVHDLMRRVDELSGGSSVRRIVRSSRFRLRTPKQQLKTKQSYTQKRLPLPPKQKPLIEPQQPYKPPVVLPFITNAPPRKTHLWPKKRQQKST